MTTPTSPNTAPDQHSGEAPTSRRALIGATAAAAAATAAALASSSSADAANGDELVLGTQNEASDITSLVATGAPGSSYLVVSDGANSGSLARQIDPGVDGVGVTVQTGVHAYTNGVASSRSVWGQDETQDGVGVYGGHWSQTAGTGMVGESFNGNGVIARGTSNDLGLDGSGKLRFIKTQTLSPTSAGAEGTLAREPDGTLWYCYSINRWQQIAGPTVAGGFVPIDPTRVYDSRVDRPSPGSLGSGGDRVVSVAASRSLDNGDPLATAVPVGATAVTYNLTVARTFNSGFLSVTPGDVGVASASSINWTTTGAVVANAGTVRIDDNRQIRVFCGGVEAATDFIIDVTGYYR